MARNKRVQDREQKQQEIINAAYLLFLAEGYDETAYHTQNLPLISLQNQPLLKSG